MFLHFFDPSVKRAHTRPDWQVALLEQAPLHPDLITVGATVGLVVGVLVGLLVGAGVSVGLVVGAGVFVAEGQAVIEVVHFIPVPGQQYCLSLHVPILPFVLHNC